MPINIIFKFFAFKGISKYLLYICFNFRNSFFQGIYNPAQFSLVPKIVKQEELKDANSISTFVLNLITIVGNSVCGFIFNILGAVGTLLCDCVTFVISIFCTQKIQCREEELPKEENKDNILEDCYNGIKYLKDNKKLLGYICLSLTLNMISGSFYILPLFVRNILEKDIVIYGFIEAFGALGMLLGAVLAIRIASVSYYKLLVMMGIGECISFIFIALGVNVVSVLFFRTIFGICNSIFNITFATVFQQEVLENYRGRIYTISFMLSTITLPIAAIVNGYLADLCGIQIAWILFGVLALLGIIINKIRHME